MSTWTIIAIVIIPIILMLGSIYLIQKSSYIKMPKVKKDNNASYDRFDEDD
jgi:hypothetical protein